MKLTTRILLRPTCRTYKDAYGVQQITPDEAVNAGSKQESERYMIQINREKIWMYASFPASAIGSCRRSHAIWLDMIERMILSGGVWGPSAVSDQSRGINPTRSHCPLSTDCIISLLLVHLVPTQWPLDQ
jgi:hypothetical protein